MRQIIVGAFISLDGVMQAPGGPEEDTSGGFQFGGWIVPYWDDSIAATMGDSFSQPFDLLLGRKTYTYSPPIGRVSKPIPTQRALSHSMQRLPTPSIGQPNMSPPTTVKRWRGKTASG